MKRITILFLLFVFNLSFSQKDSLVDIFDNKRNVIKLRASKRQLDSVLRIYKKDTLYLQRKNANYKWYECRMIRRKQNFKL